MTSLKSSANKSAAGYDFKFALKGLIFPAVVSFLLASLTFVARPLFTMSTYAKHTSGKLNLEETLIAIRNTYTSMLTSQMWDGYGILGIFVLCVGVLFALCTFSFLMRKNKINVFLSSPVGRAAMFKNRVLAVILLMGATTVIPLIIDVAINIRVFGNAGYFAWHGVLLFGEYMAYMLAGFSLMSIAMLICNTITEGLFFGAGLIGFPTVALYSFHLFADAFLRGYSDTTDITYGLPNILNKLSIVNPLVFGKAFGNYRIYYNLFAFAFRAKEGTTDLGELDYVASYAMGNGYKWAQMNIIAPFLIWLAISALFIFVAKKLFLCRRVENAGIFSVAKVPTTVIALEIALGTGAIAVSGVSSSQDYNVFMTALVGIVFALIAYYITTAIGRRKIKPAKYVNITAVGAAGVMAVFFLILNLGGLGYTTYIPDAKDIDSALISGKFVNASGNECTRFSTMNSSTSKEVAIEGYDDVTIGVFTSAEDISRLIEVNKAVAEKTDDMTGLSVKIVYRLKNGNTVTRRFDTTDYKACFDALSMTDSDAYKDELDFLLSSKRVDEERSDLGNITSWDGPWSDMHFSDTMGLFSYTDEETVKTVIQDCSAKLISDDLTSERIIENTPELKDAILADKLAADYIQKFRPSEKPIGMIIFFDPRNFEYQNDSTAEGDYEVASFSATVRYYIYESMENTISYLKSTGDYEVLANPKQYDIKSATVISCGDYRELVKSIGYDYSFLSYVFDGIYLQYDKSDEIKISFAEQINDNAADKAQSVTDADKISELYNESRSFAYASNDDMIAVFTLADGSEIVRLITKS